MKYAKRYHVQGSPNVWFVADATGRNVTPELRSIIEQRNVMADFFYFEEGPAQELCDAANNRKIDWRVTWVLQRGKNEQE